VLLVLLPLTPSTYHRSGLSLARDKYSAQAADSLRRAPDSGGLGLAPAASPLPVASRSGGAGAGLTRVTPRRRPGPGEVRYGEEGGRHVEESPRWQPPPMLEKKDSALFAASAGYALMAALGSLLWVAAVSFSRLFDDHRLTPLFFVIGFSMVLLGGAGGLSILNRGWKMMAAVNVVACFLTLLLFAAAVVGTLVGIRAAAPVQESLRTHWVAARNALHDDGKFKRVTERMCHYLATHPKVHSPCSSYFSQVREHSSCGALWTPRCDLTRHVTVL